MGREILFRGKHIHTMPQNAHLDGTWVYGYLSDENHINSPEEGEFLVDSKTVCQYTGLTDKNGRKIFEGDICKDSDNVVRILWNDKHQWGVEISKTDCVLSKGLIFPLWQYDKCEENGNRELEVIGNIFDNLELAEKSKFRKYRDMEQRLKKVYGDCDGLLEKVVEHLVLHEDITLPEPIFKARILTDGEVDRWEAYKAIGTVEECREAMEKRMAVTPTITATFYACPECGAIRSIRQKHSYCHDCGQALDWK